jgi:aryl-phospho-beta-D-glucosidase BglC (GH1 family)
VIIPFVLSLVVFNVGVSTIDDRWAAPLSERPKFENAPPASRPVHAAEPGVSARRLARLAKGVNLSHWYWLPEGGAPGFGDAKFFSKDDAAALRAAGFTHVRLPIDPSRLFTEAGGKINKGTLKKLLETIDMVVAADLGIVIEIHALGTAVEAKYDKNLHDATKPLAQKLEKAFIENWSALALELAAKDADRVFLEILNEPVYEKVTPRWHDLQTKLAAAIRASAPSHTIIASGTQWGSLSGLLDLTPLADKNIVYSFHFYEPHTFTHQGATWGSDSWKLFKDIPYPVSPDIIKPILDTIADPAARAEAKWYGEQSWNAAKIDKQITKAAEWGKKHNAAVWCGEFGTITKAPASARSAWLRDVRTACEKNAIGWCVWDYAGAFALTTGDKGSRVIDPAVAEALGLTK